nr:hypothetical protein [Tanacetum cinerariifolium]
ITSKAKKDGIFISQDKYVAEILRKFGFTYVKSASIPIETKKPLLKDLDGEDVDVHLYRYLKGKPHLGLWYPRDSSFNLVAYSDSDYAGASFDRKSTTGGLQFLGCRLISWQCKKQTVVATSSTEAEYLATASCRAQVLWIQNQLLDYGSQVNAVEVEKVNGNVLLQALINDNKVLLRKLSLDEIFIWMMLTGLNAEIFEELARMGYEKPPPKLTFYKAFFSAQWKFLIHIIVQCISAKRTTWNEFSSSMASVVICLATCRKFKFSKYIFNSMVRNVDSPSKFLMYPCFIQVLLDHQVDDMTTHNTRYKSPALTQKVFANMRRVGKGFLGVKTPPFDSMLVQSQQQAEAGVEKRVKRLENKKKSKTSRLKRLRKVGADQRVESSSDTVLCTEEDASKQEGKIVAIDADEGITLVDVETDEEVALDAEEEKARILDEKIAQKLHYEEVRKVAARDEQKRADNEKALELQRQLDEREDDFDWSTVAEQTKERQLDSIKRYQDLKKKPVSVAQARKNMMIYLKNMAGYKIGFFKEMTYDEIRPIFKREYNKIQTLFKQDKDVETTKKKRVADETLLQESFKKPIFEREYNKIQTLFKQDKDVETTKKKRVADETLLQESFKKVGGITEAYQIFKDMLKGFNKEDLVASWNLVKERFRGHDIYMLTEKDYPLSNVVMILMLSGKLQVEEDN